MEELKKDLQTICREIWQLHPEIRLEKWREFRLQSSEQTLHHYLQQMQMFWNFAPEKTLSIDPDDPNSWLTLWEMLMNTEVCKYSKGIALSLSVHYVFPDVHNQIMYVNDPIIGDTYIAVEVDHTYLLNYQNYQIEAAQDVISNLEITKSIRADQVDRLIQTRK